LGPLIFAAGFGHGQCMPTRLDTLRPTLGSPGWVHARGILVVLPGLLARGVVARLGLDTGCGFRPMPAVVHEWS
jgi:hypothetical protein